MAAHYDDPRYSYTEYWRGRDYEHLSEITAIRTLLSGLKFIHAADVGGGFGRLTPTLAAYAGHTTLIEPSNKLRSQAAQNLKSLEKLSILPGTAQHTRLDPSSQDLVMMVRVIHHIPHPLPAFSETYRILKPGGFLLLEFANSHHLKARVQSWLSGQPILPVAIDRRSPINIKRKTIPFVNHSPRTIIKMLDKSGFEIISLLSVSNFRFPILKRIIPQPILLSAEKFFQPLFAKFLFGPSIFLLAKKKNP